MTLFFFNGKIDTIITKSPTKGCGHDPMPTWIVSLSILPFLSKQLEKPVAYSLKKYMNTHSLHSPLKSTYKAGQSIETALTAVESDLLIGMDKYRIAILVLLELSAAFSMID